MDNLKKGLGDLAERAEQAAQRLAEKAEPLAQQASERIQQTVEKVQEKVGPRAEKAKAAGEKTLDTLEDLTGKAKTKLEGVAATVEEAAARAKKEFGEYRTIPPNQVATRLKETATTYGKQGLGAFCDAIKKGTDTVSLHLQKYLPTEEDRSILYRGRTFPIEEHAWIKQDFEDVKAYFRRIEAHLPESYGNRDLVFKEIARLGCKSHEDFRERSPFLFSAVRAYLHE